MSKSMNRLVRRGMTMGLVALGLSVPLLASAQFALVNQQAFVYAYAYGASPVTHTSPEGATGNLELIANAGNVSVGGSSNAVARTIVEAGRIGINAGVGGSTFNGLPPCAQNCNQAPAAGSAASVNLYFDVTQAVQATVLVERIYRNGFTYTAGGINFPLLFEKQDANGGWATMASPSQAQVLEDTLIRSRVTGVLDLDVGHYRLQGYYGSSHAPNSSYDWGGASITLTAAVPEPSTWVLMGLGLVGLGCAARRQRRQVAPMSH